MRSMLAFTLLLSACGSSTLPTLPETGLPESVAPIVDVATPPEDNSMPAMTAECAGMPSAAHCQRLQLAIAAIMSNGNSECRQIGEKLLAMQSVGKLQYEAVLTDNNGNMRDGQYDPTNDIITLSESAFRTQYNTDWIAAHEGAHALGDVFEDGPTGAGYACSHNH